MAALLNNNNRRHFNEWCNLVTDLGYENFYTILNSKNFGVPQNRDRVFMLSVRKDVAFNYRFPQGFPLTKTIADVLEEDFDPGLLLKPQNTIRFLRDEETNVDCLYVYTDHKFTDEELADVRKDPSKYEMPDIEEGEDSESEGD